MRLAYSFKLPCGPVRGLSVLDGRMAPGNLASDPAQRAKDIATALTGAVDSALRSVASGLKTELCSRIQNSPADEQEASRTCYRLQTVLLEKSQARAQRFEHFVLEYLLKVPEGPSLNSSSEQHGEQASSTATTSVGILLPREEPTGQVRKTTNSGASTRLDEEIAEMEARLAQSIRRAAALKKEGTALAKQLGLIEAVEDAGHVGLPALAAELAVVARKVNKLTGKENRDYFVDFNQQVSQTKRRGFLEDWEEEDEGPWPDTPKRQRFGLLG
eukprot:s482_g13.t1